jgi:hypothetical protein
MRSSTLLVAGVLGILFVQGVQAKADEWITPKEQLEGPTNARGTVDYREEQRAGVTFVVIKVAVDTKIHGRGKTGRGHAIYTIWKADETPYRIIDSRKYSSTNPFQTNHEESNSTEFRFVKDSFFANLDTDELEVYAEDKGGIPISASEWAKWVKDVAGPEIDAARLQVMKAAVGTVKEGPNWIIRKK